VSVKAFQLDLLPEQAQALAAALERLVALDLSHPSIVGRIGSGVEGHVVYLAEEHVAAESLDAALRHYAPAPLETAVPFIRQLAGAIDVARDAGLGHGALHPRDIFLTPEEARATGFGVADALESIGMRAPVRRPYSAPERVAGGPWDTPADVYALGAVAHELLTGRRPAGTGEVAPIAGKASASHPQLVRAVLALALAEDPRDRHPSGRAFADALEAAARGEETVPPIAGPRGPARREWVAVRDDNAREVGDDPAGRTRISSDRAPESADELRWSQPVEPGDADEPDTPPAEDDAPERESGRLHLDTSPADRGGPAEPSLFDVDVLDRVPAPPPDIWAPVPAPDGAVEAEPADERQAEEPDDRGPEADEETPADEETDGAAGRPEPARGQWEEDETELAAPIAERARPAALPYAAVLVVGLLVGFLAGYGLGSREATPALPLRQDSEAAAPAATTPEAGAPQPFSEAAVEAPVRPTPPAPAPSPVAPPTPASETPVDGGRLLIRSTPSGARVRVNGAERGETPLALQRLSFASYGIEVRRDGYRNASQQVTLTEQLPSRELTFQLERAASPSLPATAARTTPPSAPPRPAAAGTLLVDSRPRGARVFLDGRAVGTTPLRLTTISQGRHQVRFELAGYRPWTTEVTIVAGSETRVSGSLERVR